MRNPFEINWNPPHAQVQRAEKRLPYTVTDIGTGPEALSAWKIQRAEIEERWQAEAAEKRKVVRAAVVAMVADQSANPTEQDLEEIRAVKAMMEKKPKTVSPELKQKFDLVVESVEKKSLAAKAIDIINKLWDAQGLDND